MFELANFPAGLFANRHKQWTITHNQETRQLACRCAELRTWIWARNIPLLWNIPWPAPLRFGFRACRQLRVHVDAVVAKIKWFEPTRLQINFPVIVLMSVTLPFFTLMGIRCCCGCEETNVTRIFSFCPSQQMVGFAPVSFHKSLFQTRLVDVRKESVTFASVCN